MIEIKTQGVYEFIEKYGADPRFDHENVLSHEAVIKQAYNKGFMDGWNKSRQWIPCSVMLPENEQEVEITYVNKRWKTGEPLYFTCRAFYTDGTMNTEESGYTWNEIDDWEYIERMDAYRIPEGWWECVSFAEEYAAVDLPVIAWMPLPEPYEESEEK